MCKEQIENKQDYPPASKIDLLIKIINRYDTYITSTNAKASLIIAWNGVVVGSILLKYQEIINQFSRMPKALCVAPILLVVCGVLALVSNGLILGIIFPFLKPSRDGRGSLIYFGSVAQTDHKEYLKSVSNASVDDLIEDLAQQASTLAIGLNGKMLRLQKSIWVIYLELVVIALLLTLYLCKF